MRTVIGSNMSVMEVAGGQVLFSYETPVAARIKGKGYRTEVKHSVTTSKQINKYFGTQGYAKEEFKPQSFFDDLVKGAEK